MAEDKLPIAIFGAAGYTGEELLRLLLRHPAVDIRAVTSRRHAGSPIGDVFPRFVDHDIAFVEPNVEQIAGSVKLAFLALPHGLASEYAEPLLAAGVRVVDVSADFRLDDESIYQAYYGEHPAPHLLPQAVYGMPERYRDRIKEASLIACPGCYPTSIILPTSALLAAGLACPDDIVVCSMSGVSGAGRKEELPYLFAECNESVRPYKVTGHRHVPEIEQELAKAAAVPTVAMNFIPHLVPVTRGIHSTILLRSVADEISAERVGEVLNAAYANEPFVRVLPAGRLADSKHVTQTNVCEIGYAYDARTQRIILSSAEDNLTKGAAGQAVQCMNLMSGFEETTGLL